MMQESFTDESKLGSAILEALRCSTAIKLRKNG